MHLHRLGDGFDGQHMFVLNILFKKCITMKSRNKKELARKDHLLVPSTEKAPLEDRQDLLHFDQITT